MRSEQKQLRQGDIAQPKQKDETGTAAKAIQATGYQQQRRGDKAMKIRCTVSILKGWKFESGPSWDESKEGGQREVELDLKKDSSQWVHVLPHEEGKPQITSDKGVHGFAFVCYDDGGNLTARTEARKVWVNDGQKGQFASVANTSGGINLVAVKLIQ